MADLTFGVKGPTMDLSVAMKIADEDAPRILNYLSSVYGTDNDGKVRTLEEVAEHFASGILRGLLDQTVRKEREDAARAAADLIATINPI